MKRFTAVAAGGNPAPGWIVVFPSPAVSPCHPCDLWHEAEEDHPVWEFSMTDTVTSDVWSHSGRTRLQDWD